MTKRNTGKSAPVSVAIAIVTVAIVALLLHSGNIKVDCSDSSIKVNAPCWTDLDISYLEIDTISYRKDLDLGVRIFGIGSARLSVGNFQNDEFGSYTLYAYTEAKEFIVLTADDKTFIIGMSSAKETQAIYETLIERIEN